MRNATTVRNGRCFAKVLRKDDLEKSFLFLTVSFESVTSMKHISSSKIYGFVAFSLIYSCSTYLFLIFHFRQFVNYKLSEKLSNCLKLSRHILKNFHPNFNFISLCSRSPKAFEVFSKFNASITIFISQKLLFFPRKNLYNS